MRRVSKCKKESVSDERRGVWGNTRAWGYRAPSTLHHLARGLRPREFFAALVAFGNKFSAEMLIAVYTLHGDTDYPPDRMDLPGVRHPRATSAIDEMFEVMTRKPDAHSLNGGHAEASLNEGEDERKRVFIICIELPASRISRPNHIAHKAARCDFVHHLSVILTAVVSRYHQLNRRSVRFLKRMNAETMPWTFLRGFTLPAKKKNGLRDSSKGSASGA